MFQTSEQSTRLSSKEIELSPQPSKPIGFREIIPGLVIVPILLSGRLKSVGLAQVFGIDSTVVGVAILCTVAALKLALRPVLNLSAILPLLMFFGTCFLAFCFTETTEYGNQKATALIAITLPCVIAVTILFGDEISQRAYLAAWIISGFIVAVLVLYLPDAEGLLGRSGLGDDTLGPAYLLGSTVVLSIYGMSDGWINRRVGVLVTILSTVALLSIGSRGPVVAAIFCVAFWILSQRNQYGEQQSRGHRLSNVPLVAVLVAAVWLGWNYASVVSRERYFNSETGRSELRRQALQVWVQNPVLGSGWGRFAADGIETSSRYPHNIFAEVAAEMGIVGLSVLVGATLFAWTRYRKSGNSGIGKAPAALAIFWSIGQMVSFDISNRLFWLAVLPILISPVNPPRLPRITTVRRLNTTPVQQAR